MARIPEGASTYCATTQPQDLITPPGKPLRLLPPIRCAFSTHSWASHVATTFNPSPPIPSLPSIPDVLRTLAREVPALIPELTPLVPCAWTHPQPTSVASCGATVCCLDPTISDVFLACARPSTYPQKMFTLTLDEGGSKRGEAEWRRHCISGLIQSVARKQKAQEALVLRLRGSAEWIWSAVERATVSWSSSPTNVVLRVGSKEVAEGARLVAWRTIDSSEVQGSETGLDSNGRRLEIRLDFVWK